MKIHSAQQLAAFLTLALAGTLACSGSGTADGGDGNQKTSCTVALSGGQSGSPSCSTVSAVLDRGENRSGIAFTAASGATTLSVEISVAGELATGTFGKDAGADGVFELRNGSSLWGADNASGTYSMTITSVTLTQTTATLKVYTAHGTLTATLAPEDGATGTVTLSATF